MEELVSLILASGTKNSLPSVWKTIKEIDKENNGYVTNSELDDIFKMFYSNL